VDFVVVVKMERFESNHTKMSVQLDQSVAAKLFVLNVLGTGLCIRVTACYVVISISVITILYINFLELEFEGYQ
jgi:hypothetical protein